MKLTDRLTIHFDPSDLASWFVLACLVGLMVLQVLLIIRNQQITVFRKGLRVVLNGWLWLVLVGYFLDVDWTVSESGKTVLLADQTVPADYLNGLKSSLNIQRAVRVDAFKEPAFRAQLVEGKIDSILLVGAVFSPDILGQLSRQGVHLIPYYPPDQVQQIRWKAVLRQGEMQTVRGSIELAQKQTLTVRFGNQTLDSLELEKGYREFNLQFPVLAQGRTEVELLLGQKPLDTLRFFTRKPAPVSYQFILDSPDFESKTLANWLGKRGHSVEVTSAISKDIRNRIQINRPAPADVIVTDPIHAGHAAVKKAVAQGKPVFFMNGTEPETDSKAINRALGTRWSVKKISNEATVSVGQGIQALPYQFREAANHFPVAGYPVAVQQIGALVGYSLLGDTFPLELSGDSVAYNRVWTAVFAQLLPSSRNTIQLDAPVFSGLQARLYFNNWVDKPAMVQVGTDTARLNYSALNGLSAEAFWLPSRAGWQALPDSVAIYVNDADQTPVFGSEQLRAYVRARSQENRSPKTGPERESTAKIPDGIWLLLFLGGLTALWIEPKFSI
ncbi:hypothetical protein GCM10027347_13970 [Larkinella harenae]